VPDAPADLSISSPIQGTVVLIAVAAGEVVHEQQQLVVIESMKLEHVIPAPRHGLVREVVVAAGDAVTAGDLLIVLGGAGNVAPSEAPAAEASATDVGDIRDDLVEVRARHELTLDAMRPEAVGRRRPR